MRILGIFVIPLVLMSPAPAADAAPRVVVIDLRDSIQPASLRYVERGLRHAAEANADLIVIEIDTPGGLLVSARSMTSAILGSAVPVAVYVSPSGARAGSAGFFVLLAADLAAMAPGTNTGAAHPVTLGQRRDGGEDNDDVDPSLDKAANDAAALARSLAEGRKRPVEWAEKAVLESASFSADEARRYGLIELIAADLDALLEALDGRTITRFDGSKVTLQLQGAEVTALERTFAERMLKIIADPQVAYLLLMLGAFGLLIEMTNPGLIVPGIAGALSMLLGLYGLSVLPVSLIGALLIAAAFALIVAEVFVMSYGLLAIAGIASLVIGSLMLVDSPWPELQIGPDVVIPVAVVMAGFTALLAIRAARSRTLRPQSGIEAMIGEAGEVIAGIDPDHDGRVFVHGEYWTATSTQPLPEGARVRVEAVDGLRLRVAPAQSRQQGASP
jgi:membrane-bound serine protease (ClpP class)